MTWLSRVGWGQLLGLGAVLAVACQGQIMGHGTGDGSSLGPGPVGSSTGNGSGGSSNKSGGSGTSLDDAGVPSAPVIPFDALGVPASVTKVKNLLTGLAPTQAELDAVQKDPKALAGLVDAWLTLPAYSEKMEVFFADAFQQSQ